MLYSKQTPLLVIYIFPSFGQFMNTMSVKIFSFCCKPFFFYIFIWTKVLVSKCMTYHQVSGNQKEPSLVSKPHGIKLYSLMFPMHSEPVLSYVREHYHEKKITLYCLFRYSGPFSSNKLFRSVNCCWQCLVSPISPDFNSS